MTVHWHDDECGWCPCDEPDAGRDTTPAVAFSRLWRAMSGFLAVIFFLIGALITADIMGGILMAGAFIVGTSNGMVMKAWRVSTPARETP